MSLRTADCTATCEPFLPAPACLSLLSVERARVLTGTSAIAAAGMDASAF